MPLKERPKVNSIVSLTAGDVGNILYGDLTDERYPAPDSPIAKSFSPEKIAAFEDKLGIYPFTRNLLQNPKVQHQIDQGKETEQIVKMNAPALEMEYKELKEKCTGKGFYVDMFDAELPTTTCLLMGKTVEE